MSKKAKVQSIVASMLGQDEPSFNLMTSERLDLIKGLNYYANRYKHEDSKRFALKWAKTNMPEIYPMLKEQKDYRFGNWGFVLRMASRGFVLSEEQLKKIKAEFRLIAAYKEEKKAVIKKAAPATQKEPPQNKALEAFDYAVDETIQGKMPSHVAYGVNEKDNQEVLQTIERMETEMAENPDDFKNSTRRALKKFFKTAREQIRSSVKQIKIQRVKKITTSKKEVNPAKEAKNLRHKLEDSDMGLKGLQGKKIVGATKALVFDTASRRLVWFAALNENGFAISGTTLKNYDPEKSFAKTIRKPADLKEAVEKNTTTAMRKWMDALGTKQLGCNGRFNENMMILKVA